VKKKVAIFGGGIGGLSAAQELAEQGSFDVHVFEGGPGVGGKARSQLMPGTGTRGRADLPGEHGFRFFPAFYKNVIDTMRRIPTSAGRSVFDNLVGCSEMAMAEPGRAPILVPRHRTQNIGDFFRIVQAMEAFFQSEAFSAPDLARFSGKMLAYMCSCDERRMEVYEEMTFWEYVDGDRYSERFKRYINSSRFMVAMDARRGSARTIANKVIQILLDFSRASGANDRVLDGPTAARWLEPWEAHLRSLGVTFHLDHPLLGFDEDPVNHRIVGARVGGAAAPVHADYYVLSVPIEQVSKCLGPVAERDPLLRRLVKAQEMTGWMVGAQFYLAKDIPICKGHVAYPDAPWALSSVSQAQFWRLHDGAPFTSSYGDGRVHGILSVDICEWKRPGSHTAKTAETCGSAEEVLAEVWAQLKDGLNGGEVPVLTDADKVAWRLDANVTFGPGGAVNATPLLVHPPGSWRVRPEATTAVENLMLAADYVRTTTDLATMEGANEAARLAVNGIFAREGIAFRAQQFPLIEEAGRLVAVAKRVDKLRWEAEALSVSFGAEIGFGGEEELSLEQVKARQEEMIARLGEMDSSQTI
jgi:uncharacterized protein with NAD-binding domain and iron-sulfur cluster